MGTEIVKDRPRTAADSPDLDPKPARDLEGELSAHRKALADLMRSQALGQGDVSRAFKQINETAAEVLGVDRASIWRLGDAALGEPGRARPVPGPGAPARPRRRLRGPDAHHQRANAVGVAVGSAAALRRRRRAAGGDRRHHGAATDTRGSAGTGDPRRADRRLQPARRYVEDLLRKEVDRAQRHVRPPAIAMIDADHFKRVNDTHGHQTGDEVLREISARCRQTLRSNDVLARYGGEEFLVVFPETGVDEAGAVAERLRAAVGRQPIQIGDKTLEVTVSIGLGAYAPGHDLDKLVKRADAALYLAKQAGRNLVRG